MLIQTLNLLNPREVLLKKKKNAILKSQIEQYEQALNEAATSREGGTLHASQMDKSIRDSQHLSHGQIRGKEGEEEE